VHPTWGTVEKPRHCPVFITLGEPQAHGDTAEPVPFVGRFIPQAPAINEKLNVPAELFKLKRLIWAGLGRNNIFNSGRF
jgi:hypothetical protein